MTIDPAQRTLPVFPAWLKESRQRAKCTVPSFRSPRTQLHYAAAANESGTPMITCILVISPERHRETCIWLVPMICAISD